MPRHKRKLVASGKIPVPPDTPTDTFAWMEEAFRHLLWPRPLPSHRRHSRRLRFSRDNLFLHYSIWDIEMTV